MKVQESYCIKITHTTESWCVSVSITCAEHNQVSDALDEAVHVAHLTRVLASIARCHIVQMQCVRVLEQV